MSEPIPESIPTSADPRSQRPTKKRALTPVSKQAASLDALFAKNPDLDFAKPDQAKNSLAPPPELVTNVQGSSAGAGSGEFHVYKASRRREYERVRVMEEEARREKEDAEHEAKIREAKKRDEERTSKNQKRRAKLRERQAKKKKGGEEGEGEHGNVKVKKLGALKVDKEAKDGDESDEDRGAVASAAPVAADDGVGITIQDDD